MKQSPRTEATARKAQAAKRISLLEAELAEAQAEWQRACRDVGREVMRERQAKRQREAYA